MDPDDEPVLDAVATAAVAKAREEDAKAFAKVREEDAKASAKKLEDATKALEDANAKALEDAAKAAEVAFLQYRYLRFLEERRLIKLYAPTTLRCAWTRHDFFLDFDL